MADIPNIPNINQYHQHFNTNAPLIKNQPVTDRSCTDKCCVAVFIIITLLFIGGGIFFAINADFNSLVSQSNAKPTTTTTKPTVQSYDISNLKPGVPIIVGMVLFTVLLAMIFLLLLVKAPKCMFYTMIIGGALLTLALALVLFFMNQIVAGIIILVLLLIYLVVLWCGRQKIRVGIVLLLETAANFIVNKPSVFFTPLAMLLTILAFQIFWIFTFISITLYTGKGQTQQQVDNQSQRDTIFIVFWSFIQIFYSFFFYYCSVFLVATAAAMWYYNINGNYICTGLKRIFTNHLGSLTFASLIVTLVTLARQGAQRQSRQNQGAAAICYCIIACCLKMIQDLIQVLNHNAIIVMAVTGEDYIDSAKSALSLIFDNFMLFYIIDLVGGLIKFAGIIFICALPGVIGFFILKGTAENPEDTNYLTFGTLIIVLIAILIGTVFLSVLSQALSCVFIFYCLDRRLMQLGYPTPNNVPPAMKKLFDEMNRSNSHPAGYNNISNQDYHANPNQNQGFQNNQNQYQNNQNNQNYFNESQRRSNGYPRI